MAVLFIAEFREINVNQGNITPIVTGTPITEQTVAIGGSNTKSAAFNANTQIIRVHTDAICSIKIGPDAAAVATATTMRMAAGQTEYFRVNPTDKIGVITNV